MLKMVIICYNEAIDLEVMEAMAESNINNYTKVPAVFGRGENSGIHLGDDIWPGRNNILFVSCLEKEAKELVLSVKKLREKLGKEGIKAFVLPIEEQT